MWPCAPASNYKSYPSKSTQPTLQFKGLSLTQQTSCTSAHPCEACTRCIALLVLPRFACRTSARGAWLRLRTRAGARAGPNHAHILGWCSSTPTPSGSPDTRLETYKFQQRVGLPISVGSGGFPQKSISPPAGDIYPFSNENQDFHWGSGYLHLNRYPPPTKT